MKEGIHIKITVDTKEDSPEDIKKVIKMLQHLVGESSYANQPNVFEGSSPTAETGNAFASMFGDSSKGLSDQITIEGKKESKKTPQIIPY